MITIILILFVLWLVITFAISGLFYWILSFIGFVTYWEIFILVGLLAALFFAAEIWTGNKDEDE